MAKHAAVEMASHLRMRRWCKFLMERAERVQSVTTKARAVHAGFTEICGEFVGSQRADVGIGPYKMLCMSTTRRVFRK